MTQPALDPDLLRAFVAVADHRSFTRAAAALNRTQSAVSMQIRRLEDRLQVALFHRSKVHVELSPAGEGLLGYARRILALGDEAVGRLAERKVAGRVRLGVMDDYGQSVLPPILAGFAADYPAIDIEMETGLTSTMPARLGTRFDLVIAMHPAGNEAGDLLRQEPAVWAAAPHCAIGESDPLPVALYPPGCLFRKWATEALDAAGRPWRLAFVSHSSAVVEAVAAQGLAVTVVKSGTFPPSLRPLSGLPPLPTAEIRLHQAANPSAAATRLADRLRTTLRSS
jgi:DNA-binding transcriptional LysR family regulator